MYNTPFHTNNISKSSFLITGGAGFIGSNIVEYLFKYNAGKIIVLDNLTTGFKENIEPFLPLPNFKFIEGDITNFEDCKKACEGVDYVFHQAALGSVPRSVANPIATHNANATGFINMLVAARDAKVKRVVYASSSSVYGDHPGLPKVEDKIGKPLSPYAVSKLMNEQSADIFFRTYGIEVIGLRYFNIFGIRQNPQGEYAAAIPLFMNAFLKNESPFLNGDGEQTRDFTFVENAVQANVKAMFCENKNAIGQVFNIACNERTSLKQLCTALKKLSGATANPVHRADRAGDVKDSLADITKAQTILNYQPGINLEQGLTITLDWFKKKYFL